MKEQSKEPLPKDLASFMQKLCRYHGPQRYKDPDDTYNGAVTLIDGNLEWQAAEGIAKMDVENPFSGPGVVYAWFVGSPRAFLFGFARSQSAATRKMTQTLRSEYKLVTGRDVIRETPNDAAL